MFNFICLILGEKHAMETKYNLQSKLAQSRSEGRINFVIAAEWKKQETVLSGFLTSES